MTELEKIAYAKSFIDKLANGINPINDSAIPVTDTVNNLRLSRCFLYVSSLLAQMIDEKSRKEKNGEKTEKPRKRVQFDPLKVPLEKFRFSDEPITIGEMHRRLDELVDLDKMRRISRSRIPIWLVKIGMLTPPSRADRSFCGQPTEAGLSVGISTLLYVTEYGEQSTISFNREAQQFIIDHLEIIIKASMKDRTYQA